MYIEYNHLLHNPPIYIPYKESICAYHAPEADKKNLHLPSILSDVTAPLDPGDTCTLILTPNAPLFPIPVFLKNAIQVLNINRAK